MRNSSLNSSRIIAILATTFAITGPIPAGACSCEFDCKSLKDCVTQSFKGSAAIFVGTPVKVVEQKKELKGDGQIVVVTNYRIRFQVREAFKGVTTGDVVADAGSGGASCSYGKMDEGRDYLVYAYSDTAGSNLDISLCSRTRALDGGLGRKPPYPGSHWSEKTKKSMHRAARARQKELAFLRKLSHSRSAAK